MGSIFDGACGSLVPHSHWALWDAQLSQSDLEEAHPTFGEKTTLLDSSFNECIMFSGTRLEHEMKADSERRLPPTAWLHGFQEQPGVPWETPIHPDWRHPLRRGGWWGDNKGTSLGKLPNCRNWSIWHTVGRNISERCSFQRNHRREFRIR